MKRFLAISFTAFITLLVPFALSTKAYACTYVRLVGTDGSSHPGRTMEWGSFDLKPRFTIMPRGSKFKAMDMPDGKAGASWTGKYGFGGVSIVRDGVFSDVVNEEGLVINLLYLPGFAEYQPYDPAQADKSISPTDFMTYLASQFADVAEAKAALDKIRVVPITEPALGFPAPVHFVISDRSGAEMVVEYVNGELRVHEDSIGVMTNSPPYDWHLNNLRNYINLRQTDWKPITVEGMKLAPIGVGTGLLGLPGDFTPPSRFVRAMAFKATARKTAGGVDTMLEHFRILDSFQLPLEGTGENLPKGLDPLKYSSTQYTISIDTKNMVFYYHTDDDRTVRKVDLGEVNWKRLDEMKTLPLRTNSQPIIDDVTKSLLAN